MTYYGVGEAYQESRDMKGKRHTIPPEFDKIYTSIVEARKELYRRVMGNKGSPITLYVYNLSNKQQPDQIGCGYRTIVNLNYKVVSGKKWIIWEPFSPRGGSLGVFYYLNKDGTLGAKR